MQNLFKWILRFKAVKSRKTYFSNIRHHEIMLSDQKRCDGYRIAISTGVHNGQHVLDVGTGTGLLARFAAQQGAYVTAIDDSCKILRVAKSHPESIGITFKRMNSRMVKDYFDVIIFELFGSFGLNEGVLDTISDLRYRCLSQNGEFLPDSFELFCEPVHISQFYNILPLESFGFPINMPIQWHKIPPECVTLLRDPVPVWTCKFQDAIEIPLNLFPFETSDVPDAWAIFFRASYRGVTVCESLPFHPYSHWNIPIFKTTLRQVHLKIVDTFLPETWVILSI